MFVSYCQVGQIASDCAAHMANNIYIPSEDVVVPFVTTSWDDVQFGAVYLLENNYPCAVLLSRRLSLNCYPEILEICFWIKALSMHCVDMASLISASKRNVLSRQVPSLTKRMKLNFNLTDKGVYVTLPDANNHIFKPVKLPKNNSEGTFRALLSRLMSRFYDMFHCGDGELKEVFP